MDTMDEVRRKVSRQTRQRWAKLMMTTKTMYHSKSAQNLADQIADQVTGQVRQLKRLPKKIRSQIKKRLEERDKNVNCDLNDDDDDDSNNNFNDLVDFWGSDFSDDSYSDDSGTEDDSDQEELDVSERVQSLELGQSSGQESANLLSSQYAQFNPVRAAINTSVPNKPTASDTASHTVNQERLRWLGKDKADDSHQVNQVNSAVVNPVRKRVQLRRPAASPPPPPLPRTQPPPIDDPEPTEVLSDDEAVASLSSTQSASSSGTGFTNSMSGSSLGGEEEDYCVPIDRSRLGPPITEPKPTWLKPSLDRAAAERMLAGADDGRFLIRMARRAGANFPYSLSVAYRSRVYHLPIRHTYGLDDDNYYSLGKGIAGSKSNRSFETLGELVNFYVHAPLLLVTNGRSRGDQVHQEGRHPIVLKPLT